MSHSSGIPVSKDLADVFAAARSDASLRALKVQIVDDKLVCAKQVGKSGNEEADFDKLVDLLDERLPMYAVFRRDEGEFYMLVMYIPDRATVKDKMIYASTRDNLKRELGYSYFNEEYHCTEPSEVSYAAYKDHKHRQTADFTESLLTETERAKRMESRMEKDIGGTQEYVHGVSFPMTDAARDNLKSFASGNINWLQLMLDVKGEMIDLGEGKNASASSVASNVSDSSPAFYFYAFDHTHEGESKKSNVFIYACPEDAPIKSKMVHSTTKSAVLDVATNFGINVQKKLEIRGSEELSEQIIMDELYPQKDTSVKTFSKPSRPGGGARRLHRKKE